MDPDTFDQPDATLAPVVNRLREEVEGLRRAMSTRSIIEQAKGMLMERYGCSPDEAFDRLARLSQHANIKLTDVASALIESSISAPQPRGDLVVGAGGQRKSAGGRRVNATTSAVVPQPQISPRWPRQGSGDNEFAAQLRARARRTRTRSELLAARTPQDLVSAVVRTGLADQPPSAAVLATVEVNGVVTVRGSHGIPGPVVTRWRTFPLDLDLPICATLRAGQIEWLVRSPENGRTRSGRLATLGVGLPDDWGCSALLPLSAGGGCHGVFVLVWPSGHDIGPTARREIEQIAAGVAVTMRKLPQAVPTQPPPSDHVLARVDSAVAVLDVLLSPVLLCEPIVDSNRTIVDLRVTHANPAATDLSGTRSPRLEGRSFLELYPDSVTNGLFRACRTVVKTGVQVDLPGITWRVRIEGTGWDAKADARVTRYRSGVLITCVYVSAVERDGPGASEAKS